MAWKKKPLCCLCGGGLVMETIGKEQHDNRMLVLVLIGLCLCLSHLYRAVLPGVAWRGQLGSPSRIVWLETSAFHGNGLYQLDLLSDTWQAMSAGLDFHSPAELLPAGVNVSPPAYHLQSDGKLQSVFSPAQVAPIFFQPIPINQASIDTLRVIPGIGQRLARAILDYRERVGGITDRESLLNVEGIGEKKAAIIAGCVRFE